MKKILITLGIVCLALVSCNKTESVVPSAPEQQKHISFNISVDDLTKATKTNWENGDKIILFFDKEIISTPRYVTMAYDGTKWGYTFNEATLESDLLGKTSGTVSAVYVPYWHSFNTEYYDGWGYPAYYLRFYNEAEDDVMWAYYLRCMDAAYSVSAGVVSASLTLSQPGAPSTACEHIFIPGITGNDRYTLQASNLLKVMSCCEYSFDAVEHFRGGVAGYNNPIPGYEYQGGMSFSGYFANKSIPDDYTFTLIDNNGTVADTSDDTTYQISFTGKTIQEKGAIQLPALSNWSII